MAEFSSLAPGPLCAMILADFGADVVLIERPGEASPGVIAPGSMFSRGKRSMVADLKNAAHLERIRELIDETDVLIEGNRPGVMERLGLGPDALMKRNPGLIYARVTGWGQDGPYAHLAGHDINYIAVGGPLAHVGVDEPVPPSSFVGDFASGALHAVIGILLALHGRATSKLGQVVDAAMVDGSAQLMVGLLEMQARGLLAPRGENSMDGLAPYYRCYQCSDGRWFSVGAIEPIFYRRLLDTLGLEDEPTEQQLDRERWPALRARIGAVFASRTSAEWEGVFGVTDACAAPVVDLDELLTNRHLAARELFLVGSRGVLEPAPAPRLLDTPARAGARPEPGQHTARLFSTSGWPYESPDQEQPES